MKNLLQAFSSRPHMTCLAILAMLLAGILGYGQSADTTTSPTIAVTALDVTTGQQISNGQTITVGDQFQATVTVTNNIDCAGQFVVTALGAPGAPPEVLVQTEPFIIGPAREVTR